MTNAQNTVRAPRRPGALLGALIGMVALFGLAGPASALAAPVLQVDSSHVPATVPAGTYARYTLVLRNTGPDPSGPGVSVEFTTPAEMEVIGASGPVLFGGALPTWTCTLPDSQTASCALFPGFGLEPGPGQEACLAFGSCRITVTVKADENAAPGTVLPAFRATGGGSVDFNGTDPVDIGPPPVFDLVNWSGEVVDEFDVQVDQAGAHPHLAHTNFATTTAFGATGEEVPIEQLKDAVVKLTPGLVGNPQAIPTCTQAQLVARRGRDCPVESQVGVVRLFTSSGDSVGEFVEPVFHMERPGGTAAVPIGTPALFAFIVEGVAIQVYARVRTGEDYGVTIISKNAPQTLQVYEVDFTFWGVPADPAHDIDRGYGVGGDTVCARTTDSGCRNASSAPVVPFISLPTSCTGDVDTSLDAVSWSDSVANSTFVTSPGGTGCPTVPFEPSVEARPTTNAGDQPSGLDVELRIPQSNDPGILASSHLKDTTVVLPEGLVINPSGANGLDGCSLAEFGYTSTDPDGTIHTTPGAGTCPNASKVADVEINTPVLDHPIRGSAHIADPYDNPFGSLLALYITVYDPETGIVAKLAGKVTPDSTTGQLTTVFEENPQLPFETFRLHFKGGAHGTLRTPAICGEHTTQATLVPWAATGGKAPSDETDTWQITNNCSDSEASQPHAPSFDAGVVNPQAGINTPFVMHLRREDGSQNFSAVTVSPPQGLTAKLAGTPACSDGALAAAAGKAGKAEQAAPSCPLASQIGSVDVAAGAGPAPYHAPAKAYLAGPYKGAPLSMAVIAPAVAGPFDLGTVVTRIALHVNPATAEITAASDPVPSILQGIPLDVKTISVSLNKPDFVQTGTSCDPSAVNGLLTSTLGAVANLQARYQLAECTGLGFKPRMALRLKGGTARGKHPQLSAYVLPRPGDANIKSVSVSFPRSEFLENAHIRTICTRPDFAADNCPAGAIYGTSVVETPLLDYPLVGNVYLRSSDNLLPDVVPDLRGPAHQPIKVEAAGRTDSIRGGIRNTFDFFPDAPFTRAILRMQGGNKGLLVNSRNICARTYRAVVKFTGHNNMTHTIRPKLVAQSCKKKRKKAKRKGHKRSKRIALSARASVR